MGWDWFYIGNRLQETQPNQILRKHPSVTMVDYYEPLPVSIVGSRYSFRSWILTNMVTVSIVHYREPLAVSDWVIYHKHRRQGGGTVFFEVRLRG